MKVPSRQTLRLIGFASGDFGFNLFWQSTSFFLLFYYTDALGVAADRAGALFLVASVWDGLANLLAGLAADEGKVTHGQALMWGAVPLGLAFFLTYIPLGQGWAGLAALLAANLVFRSLYAWLNVGYLALSAEIAIDSSDRALLSGARMAFGTAAALLVAIGTRPLGVWLGGTGETGGYLDAAAFFAMAGAGIIAIVGRCFGQARQPAGRGGTPIRRSLIGLARNRAFVTLNLAMMAMIVAVTVLSKSTLYYFKYAVGDLRAGQLAIASMSLVGLVAIPVWTVLARRIGGRRVWLVASGLAGFQMLLFLAGDATGAVAAQIFLVGLQAAVVGLHFVFWAMLPNTIEFGEERTGLRADAVVFGVAALLQRVGIGIATAILGWQLRSAGYHPDTVQPRAALAMMRQTIVVIPFCFLLLSALLMLANPLKTGVHTRILERLRARG